MAEVEDLDDAGIGDRGRSASFVEEPLHDVGAIRDARLQHLDRRAATEHRVLGEPDLAHAAGAQAREQSIRTHRYVAVHGAVIGSECRGL
jgi:hypothetical protein